MIHFNSGMRRNRELSKAFMWGQNTPSKSVQVTPGIIKTAGKAFFLIMSITSKAFWGNFYIVKSDNRFTLHFLFIMVILGKSHFSPPKLHGFVLSVWPETFIWIAVIKMVFIRLFLMMVCAVCFLFFAFDIFSVFLCCVHVHWSVCSPLQME